uniref:Helitron helicase-like domain-containing protein n=1 Tax=Amphimedon queenslandica TaxID=400682 RepID=A0A1X7U7S1_AMPQE
MIAEYGSPTLILTLSCADYDSADIAQYLRKVNNAPQSYSISRLCTEDPVSVSQQFSYKMKNFFNIVIHQRGVLGKVEQYYVKKNIKCVVRLIITSSYGLKILLLSVSIIQNKSVPSYKIELPAIYQIVIRCLI